MAFRMDQFGVPKFRRLGVNVVVIDADGSNRLQNQERIWRLHADARTWNGVLESVPGMNNLTLLYDERQVAPEDLERNALDAWNAAAVDVQRSQRLHVIDVDYGGEAGPDLADVASAVRLPEREVVALHMGREYVVYFLGFQPGFAYLGDIDERLRVPRRDSPRASVPPGSIAIALNYTAVYPFASPGGWHIIGRTRMRVFDATRGAALFAAGDRVRFRERT